MYTYYVYIMSSRSRVLYVGVTNDLERRVYEHKHALQKGFSSRYKTFQLIYYEEMSDVDMAITREKQIKKWRRSKKITLIERVNPTWRDMAEDWFD